MTAEEMFKELGFRPDLFNGVGNIYAETSYEFIQAGNREQAVRLFNELISKGIKLDYLGNKING